MEHDAPSKPELNREIATTADGVDITRGYIGPLLMPYDSVLRQRGGGDLLIYEQVLSDPEVKSTFGQRQLAVTSAEWAVDAGGKRSIDEEAAEFWRKQLQTIGWDNVTNKMLYGVFYGFAVAELIYGVDGRRLVIKKIKVRNRRRFRYGKEGDLRLLTMQQMYEGVPAEAPYFWHFASGADNDDEPYGTGLAHWLYWPVLFKRNGLKFWLIFLEKFAAPTAVGKYGPGAHRHRKGAPVAGTERGTDRERHHHPGWRGHRATGGGTQWHERLQDPAGPDGRDDPEGGAGSDSEYAGLAGQAGQR